MRESSLDVETISIPRLRAAVRGQVIAPGDPEYDAARAVFLRIIDRYPAAIVRPADAADVASVVSLAGEAGAEIAVRGGGHSVPGYGTSDGGVVLDLSSMHALDIDVTARTAWVETGSTAAQYTVAAGAYGLATGFGDTGSVGVGGITLGGGVGFLHRKYGLTIDSLLAAEIVTADGRILHTDEETHPDLFWAIRGGGGNFGVATRFQFRLHEVDEATSGLLLLSATPEVIASVIAAAEEAPEEISGMINVMPAPPMPFVPAEHHGRPVVLAMLLHAGDHEAGRRALAPFRSIAPPLADLTRPIRYVQVYEGGEPPQPPAIALRSTFLDTVDRTAAEAVLDNLQRSSAAMRVAQFRVLGGAVSRVPADATAFAHRDRRIMASFVATYDHPDEAAERFAWVDRFDSDLRQGEPGAYVGFLADEGEAAVRKAYPDRVWARLRRVKARYDPGNLFRLNQNIPPADDAL